MTTTTKFNCFKNSIFLFLFNLPLVTFFTVVTTGHKIDNKRYQVTTEHIPEMLSPRNRGHIKDQRRLLVLHIQTRVSILDKHHSHIYEGITNIPRTNGQYVGLLFRRSGSNASKVNENVFINVSVASPGQRQTSEWYCRSFYDGTFFVRIFTRTLLVG